MFDTSGGGAGDSARDGKAAGTGGMNLDRMMMASRVYIFSWTRLI